MPLGLVSLLLTGTAAAQEGQTFKDRYERAVNAFKAADYDRAIVEFQGAYDLRPQPLLLFNLAQAHRKAGHVREALTAYQRFLTEEQKPDLKPETEKYIDEMMALIKAEEDEIAQKQAERERAEAARVQLRRDLLAEPAPWGYDKSGRRLVPPARPYRTIAWATAGAGLLAVAAGAALMAIDGRPTCELGAGQTLCPQQLNTLTGGGIAVGVGAALLGTSAAFFVLDYRRGREGEKTAMLMFSGRF